ncbi:hypothetical protein BSKO_08906 [Bryopsis sp. KO-2023]|nr:hypothetical protein BSKO_08906 [Bryopsis sp. KO-2023]
MPSESAPRLNLGSEPQEVDRYAIVAQRNGERFVWNRESNKGFFLREDVWPRCSIEERTLPSSQKQTRSVVSIPSAVDAVFLRYIRQKRLSETSVQKLGRHARRRQGRWLLSLVESAHEIDYLTEVLADTVRRSATEDLLSKMQGLPAIDEKWSICQKNYKLLPIRSPRVAHRSGHRAISSHVLRCVWTSPQDNGQHELVIFYGFRPEQDADGMQLWHRKSSETKDYQHLMELGSFMEADIIASMEWRLICKERAMEELMMIPQDGRTSSHAVGLMRDVFLMDREQKFANMLCLAQSAAMFESGLVIERDALRDEVAVYRRQLAMSGSGPSGWNVATKDTELPHYVEAMRNYHRLVDRVKNFYFDFSEGSSDNRNRKVMFAECIYVTLKRMLEIVLDRYNHLLHNVLAALGNLECPNQVSRSTHDAFDVYCRKHWKDLFLSHMYPGQNDGSNSASNKKNLNLQLRQEMFFEFPSLVGSEGDGANFERIFNGLWESTVVMFLQRPQLRFSVAKKRTVGVYSSMEHEFVDREGKEGDEVVVLIPAITKKSRPCSFKESVNHSAMNAPTVVEKGYVDLL